MRVEALLFGILTLLPAGFQSERESSYSSIREIDFRNFTYPARPSIGGRGAFTLRNGETLPKRDGDGHVIGHMVLETYSPDGKRGDCCPVAYIKTRYRLHKNKISVVGKPEVFPFSN
jgi:hypothetical protein